MANNVCNFVNEHRYFAEALHEFENQGGGDSIFVGDLRHCTANCVVTN